MKNILDYETVSYDAKNNKLVIIDQTKLPNDIELLFLDDIDEIFEAICTLKVRGAPAIGVAAAITVAVIANKTDYENYKDFYNKLKKDIDYLASSRPTAVNLFWALKRMEEIIATGHDLTIEEIKKCLIEKAISIKEEDINICKKIGINGLKLINNGDGILTHCNAGQLAAVKYGTALAPIYVGYEQGNSYKVYCDETRPLLQGGRLTSFELASAGVDTTVICDNMAGTLMSEGKIQAIFVGCDRVAANGDTANKIGTMPLAVLAKHFNIPFYVCAPSSTIDMLCNSGKDIEIEHRNGDEITKMWYKKPMVNEEVKTYNPAFDVTNNELITAFVTEFGIVKPPFKENFKLIIFENKLVM